MNSELTDVVVAQYLRGKAKVLLDAARALEQGSAAQNCRVVYHSTSDSNGASSSSASEESFDLGAPTADEVRRLVTNKKYRAKELAQELHASQKDIEKIIDDPSNGFQKNTLGWISLGT